MLPENGWKLPITIIGKHGRYYKVEFGLLSGFIRFLLFRRGNWLVGILEFPSLGASEQDWQRADKISSYWNECGIFIDNEEGLFIDDEAKG